MSSSISIDDIISSILFLLDMHREKLTSNQIDSLPLISSFKRECYLVGGIDITLYLGHRRSIDFDLFKYSTINHKRILEKINNFQFSYYISRHIARQFPDS